MTVGSVLKIEGVGQYEVTVEVTLHTPPPRSPRLTTARTERSRPPSSPRRPCLRPPTRPRRRVRSGRGLVNARRLAPSCQNRVPPTSCRFVQPPTAFGRRLLHEDAASELRLLLSRPGSARPSRRSPRRRGSRGAACRPRPRAAPPTTRTALRPTPRRTASRRPVRNTPSVVTTTGSPNAAVERDRRAAAAAPPARTSGRLRLATSRTPADEATISTVRPSAPRNAASEAEAGSGSRDTFRTSRPRRLPHAALVSREGAEEEDALRDRRDPRRSRRRGSRAGPREPDSSVRPPSSE